MAKQITSAAANKLLKKLQDEKDYLLNLERESSTYIVVDGYEPTVPAYDYHKITGSISDIDTKISKIKHAVNVFNTTTLLPDFTGMEITVDEALITMAQLTKRKNQLDEMRKRLPSKRKRNGYGEGNNLVEYICTNYNIDVVKADYDSITDLIVNLQMGIDFVNQTIKFEVDL